MLRANGKTINSGVYIRGHTKVGEEGLYGIIQHIYGLECNTSSSGKKV